MVETASPGIVVLVAEDETLLRLLAAEMLEDAGYQVYEARDGQEALTILELRGSGIRALLSDIAMPNLNGLDLARAVSGRWPHIGIILASAYPPPDLQSQIPGDARFVSKPYTADRITQAVESVLRTKAGLGVSAALHSIPTLRAGQMHGAGGLAQPLPEPDE
jgi:CheY-like chemotaxis protein